MVFYLSRSPLQLLNCIEACETFDLRNEKHIVVVAYVSERDKIIMADLIKNYPYWNNVYFFKLRPAWRQVVILIKILLSNCNFKYLFYGDSTGIINFFINNFFKFENIYMVDDGTATLYRSKQISEKSLHLKTKFFRKSNKFLTSINLFIGILPIFLYKANFFTFYNIESIIDSDKIVENKFKYVKSLLLSKEVNNEVWFIGSNIKNEILKDKKNYFHLLDKVNDKRDLSKVIYIAHRKEIDSDLELISKKFNLEVRRFDTILEIVILNSTSLPCELISFGSSAIDTLEIMFSPSITLYRIPDKEIVSNRLEPMQGLYADSARKNRKIVSLE